MSNFQDLTNNIYGRLKVLSFDKKNNNKMMWLCKCECGNIKSIWSNSLKRGDTKSCGCLAKELKKIVHSIKYKDASFNNLYRNYINSAKKRNYKFELSKNEFKYLTSQNCYYCGIEPKQTGNKKYNNGHYIHNGIDRIDNTKGYIKNNCVPCCSICNIMKKDLSINDFYLQLNKILNYKNPNNGV